jgi:hypothetical protein
MAKKQMSKEDIVEMVKALHESAATQRDAVLYDRKQQDAACYFQGQCDVLELVLHETKKEDE